MTRMIAFRVRQWHKWVSLIIGAQAMIWLASGLYMVVMNLDFIHGDHLVRNMSDTISSGYEPRITFSDVLAGHPDANEIVLTNWIGKPFYRIYSPAGAHLVNAETGNEQSPLGEADAISVARYHYARSGEVSAATLLENDAEAPSEIQSRKLPLWRIDFSDAGSTSFYVSPDDGSLITRRHTYWRVFDFAWMLHIMDYDDGENVTNGWLRLVSLLALLAALSGMALLLLRFTLRKKAAL